MVHVYQHRECRKQARIDEFERLLSMSYSVRCLLVIRAVQMPRTRPAHAANI